MQTSDLLLAFEFQAATLQIEPFEIVLLGAGALLTLGMIGFFVFMLTRKEKT